MGVLLAEWIPLSLALAIMLRLLLLPPSGRLIEPLPRSGRKRVWYGATFSSSTSIKVDISVSDGQWWILLARENPGKNTVEGLWSKEETTHQTSDLGMASFLVPRFPSKSFVGLSGHIFVVPRFPSKSGLMNKHIVKHIRTNTQTHREHIENIGSQCGGWQISRDECENEGSTS
jgi:hypothetical protein